MEKIKIHTIIEIAGSPEEHVKETINKVIDIIKKNDKLKIIKKEIAPTKKVDLPKEVKNQSKLDLFSTFAELEVQIPNFDELVLFCFTFMPSSIEILEPEEIKVTQKELEDSLNDLLGRLHEQARVMIEYQALKQRILKAKPPKVSGSKTV